MMDHSCALSSFLCLRVSVFSHLLWAHCPAGWSLIMSHNKAKGVLAALLLQAAAAWLKSAAFIFFATLVLNCKIWSAITPSNQRTAIAALTLHSPGLQDQLCQLTLHLCCASLLLLQLLLLNAHVYSSPPLCRCSPWNSFFLPEGGQTLRSSSFQSDKSWLHVKVSSFRFHPCHDVGSSVVFSSWQGKKQLCLSVCVTSL